MGRDGLIGGTAFLPYVAALCALLTAQDSSANPTDSRPTAIVGATIFDGTGAPPHVASVVIQHGRILDVGTHVRIPGRARIIHAGGEALLPGLFDLHTHWTPGGDPGNTPQIASAYVAAGVTTVNDFNAAPESYEPRRRWLASLVGPHVNFAARVSTPGGHGADWGDTSTTSWVNTPEAARAAIDGLLPYKPDLIKAFTDGWRYGTAPDNTSMDERTLSALVEAAHSQHLEVFTHTVTVDRGGIAARSKVDVIAHSLQDRPIDPDTIAAIKASGTALAPTLAVYEPVKPGQRPPQNPDDPRVKQGLRKFGYALQNTKALHDAGVMIALGTDSGMPGTRHGFSTSHELELLVQAGLTPLEALIAGTANSARAIGQLDDRGTIEKGKRADLVLVRGAPWAQIGDVRHIDRVFIDGQLVFGPGSIPAPAPSDHPPAIVARQVIDDFERQDGRSSLDTLRVADTDGGLDRTVEISQLISRGAAGHALSVTAKMAVKPNAFAGIILPLSRGSIQPVDVRAFHGVRFDIRGEGSYIFGINTLAAKWTSEVSANSEWRTLEVPFSALVAKSERRASGENEASGPGGHEGSVTWRADNLTEVEFLGERPPGGPLWMEIDNVEFY